MDVPANPFGILTFISAPAVLTNASCVLLFGTGNRYGRAIDRVHELAGVIEGKTSLDEAELRLRIHQLSAAETRTLLIVRALTCFYSAAAGFVASTLASLIGAVLASTGIRRGVGFSLVLAFLTGSLGVLAVIAGAIMLARETRFSFQVLREEKSFLSERMRGRLAKLTGTLTEPS
jgi:hypothetical protein